MNVLGQDAPGNLLDLMNLQGSVSLLKVWICLEKQFSKHSALK